MAGKKLLIYYPPNKRAIGLNAVIDLISSLNIEIFLLTQQPYGPLHSELEKKLLPGHCIALNIPQKGGIGFYVRHAAALIRFCRKHRIDIVFSHLQVANLVSLVASPFLFSTRFIYFRHHFHYFKKFKVDYLRVGRNELLGEKLINRFAKKIVVPSSTVLEGMVKYESVNPKKIRLIPYIYNFEEYPKRNCENVKSIRAKYKAELLLLMSSRFVEPKRHHLVLSVLVELIRKGMNVKLLLLDDGPLKEIVKQTVLEFGLSENVFFIGYTDHILDYMAASDLLVHPSLAEASNSSVKEMSLAGKTAVVCRGVGDFDDYVINYENGFLIDPMNSGEELKKVIEFAYFNTGKIAQMGAALKETVLKKFSPNESVLQLYKSIMN